MLANGLFGFVAAENMDSDFNLFSLYDLAQQNYPLMLPWSNEPISPGTGFNSKVIAPETKLNPWSKESPFECSTLFLQPEVDGGVCAFRSSESSRSEAASEHLSVNLGLTVGCSFLSGNVTGVYDKAVAENCAGYKSSKNMKIRTGRVFFANDPRLSSRAIQVLLRSKAEFQAIYGDYYIAGLELGADIGACLTVSDRSWSETETVKISVTVKALCWSDTTESRTSETMQISDFNMSFAGYDTLKGTNEIQHLKKGQKIESLQSLMQSYSKRIEDSHKTVLELLTAGGYKTAKKLDFADCPKLFEYGVVSQLILMPYSKLPQLMRLTARSSSIYLEK